MPVVDPKQHIQAHWVKGVFYERALMADAWSRFGQCDLRRIYDIGASIGNHTAWFALAWPAATVYAFEPWPASLRHLQATVEANALGDRVVIDRHAIGRSFCTAHMAKGQNEGMHHIVPWSDHPVPMVPLYGIPYAPPDLIKIDAEGCELDVLDGAREVLFQFSPPMYIEGDREKLESVLIPAGYRHVWTGCATPTHLFVADRARSFPSKQSVVSA